MSTKSKKGAEKNVSYSVGDLVLAKIRGYPAWPALVVDPANVPEKVKKEQPKGKSAFHCVRFLTAGDYSFPQSKDLTKLQKHEIEAYVADPVKKSDKNLTEAYKAALNPQEWLAAKEAEAQQTAEAEDNDPVDQLEDSGEENGDAKKTKKRKRDSEPKSKAASKPKKAADSSAAKKKTGPKKSSKNVESEDEAGGEGDENGKEGNKSSAPPAKKAKRDDEDPMEKDPEAKKVRDWRHKLQKVLLNAKAPAKPEDIPAMDSLFTTIEQYDKMTLAYLTFSKIGKVMRHVTQLSSDKLPRDEEFNIRARAQALVEKWSTHISGSNGDKASTNAAESKTDAPAPESEVATSAPVNGDKATEAGTANAAEAPAEGQQ